MVAFKLPVSRMNFKEVLQTSLGLTINGHEEAAEELMKQWMEVEQ